MKFHKLLLIFAACLLFVGNATAAVPSSTSWLQYTLTTNPQTLPVTFVFQNSTDLLVLDTRGAAAPVTLTLNSDYSVSGGSGSTGSVATIAGGANGVLVGDVITVSRAVPLTQTTSFTNTGPLTAAMIGQALDKQTEISQQINVRGLNSFRFQADEVIDGTMLKALRSSKYLAFDANGAPTFLSNTTAGPSDATFSTVTATGSTTARALGVRFAETKNVLDYGAVGNGTANDTAAIQAAVTAAGAYGTILLPAGKTFKTVSQITLLTGQTVWGYGAIVTSDTDAHFQKFKFSSVTGGGVFGVTFNCLYTSASTGLSAGVVEIINANDVTVRDCRFNDVAKNGVYVYGTSTRDKIVDNWFSNNFCAIFSDDDTVNQPTRLTIIGNDIRNGIGSTSTSFSGAIKISGTGNANSSVGHTIVGNTIVSPGQMGIELQTWVNGSAIANNTIYSAGFGISISGCANVSLSDNNIKACVSYGVEIASFSVNISVTAGVVDGTDTSGTVVTSRGIYVNAAGASVTGVVVFKCGVPIDLVFSSNVTVSGCSLSASGAGTIVMDIKDTTDFAAIGNTMTAYSSPSCFITMDSTDAAVARGVIANNAFNGSVSDRGISAYSPANSITDVLITGNITSSATSAIAMYDTIILGGGSVSRVRVEKNLGTGLQDISHNLDLPVFATTNSLTLSANLNVVLVDASGGAKTETLPSAVGLMGRSYEVVKTDSSGNAVGLATISSQTISGNNAAGSYVSATTYSLAAQGARVSIVSDGANWVITQAR